MLGDKGRLLGVMGYMVRSGESFFMSGCGAPEHHIAAIVRAANLLPQKKEETYVLFSPE